MKELFTLFSIFLLGLVLTSCNNNKYKLTVIDDFEILYKPLNEYYEAGEEVEVYIIFLSGCHGGINLNGEHIKAKVYKKGYPGMVYTFTMPSMDSTLYTTLSGYILRECENEDAHIYDDGRLDIFSSVAPPPMVYTCKLCGHKKREFE